MKSKKGTTGWLTPEKYVYIGLICFLSWYELRIRTKIMSKNS